MGHILLLALLLAGCGGDEAPVMPRIDSSLVIVDSIGVELGDTNLMLGGPVNPCFTPDGSVAFLDRMKFSVFFFTPDGEFIERVGRKGEGPGEFLRSNQVFFYPDGRMVVRDLSWINLFGPDHEFIDRKTWDRMAPFLAGVVDSCGMVGIESSINEHGGITYFVTRLCRWDLDGEETTEYWSFEREFDPDVLDFFDFSSHRNEGIWACCSLDGKVFYAAISVDQFDLHGLMPDGSEYLHINDGSVGRVEKSQEEIQAEIDAFMSRFTGVEEFPIEVEPDPYRMIVRGMFVDGRDRLWIRLGYLPGIVFRVYDMEGEVLFHTAVEYDGNPVDLNSWEVTGNPWGIVAYDTSRELCPRVYVLELIGVE